MGMAETHREAFRDEALELLSELESALLELEYRPDEQELIGRTFRAMHTIKGSGGMFGSPKSRTSPTRWKPCSTW